MLLTDRFVFVHMPKTGGTFVSKMLFQLYGADYDSFTRWNSRLRWSVRLLRGRLARTKQYGTLRHWGAKHSTCEQIPRSHSATPILGVIRNPYDWYVSEYEFRWWRRDEHARRFRQLPDFHQRYPRFPDLTFPEFMNLSHAASATPYLGNCTRSFIRFFFRNPQSSSQHVTDTYIHEARYRSDMYPVRFLRQDHLNQDLHDALLDFGYYPKDLAFILTHDRVLPRGRGRPPSQNWRPYYTPELKSQVRHRDRLLFHLHPEYDT